MSEYGGGIESPVFGEKAPVDASGDWRDGFDTASDMSGVVSPEKSCRRCNILNVLHNRGENAGDKPVDGVAVFVRDGADGGWYAAHETGRERLITFEITPERWLASRGGEALPGAGKEGQYLMTVRYTDELDSNVGELPEYRYLDEENLSGIDVCVGETPLSLNPSPSTNQTPPRPHVLIDGTIQKIDSFTYRTEVA